MLKAMNKILWLIETILVVIILITIFIIGFNFYQLKILKKDYVNFFGYSVFEVVSNSMAPTIEKKDIIIVKVDSIFEENDIITYKLDNSFVTHRITDIKDDHFVTRGDANNSQDTPISKKEVIGEVIQTIPNLGLWRDVLMTPSVLISIFVTLALFNFTVFNMNGSNKNVKKKEKFDDFRVKFDNIIEEFKND